MATIISSRSIGRRFGWVQTLVLVIALVGSGLGYWGLHKVAQDTESIYTDALATERVASDWYRNVFNGITRTTAIAVSTDTNLPGFFAQAAAESSKKSTELQQQLDKLLTTPQERASFEKISDLRKTYLSTRDAIAAAKKAGETDRAKELFDKFSASSAVYLDSIQAVVQAQREQLDNAIVDLRESNRRARIALVLFSIVALVTAGVLSWRLTRSITGPLQQAAEVADAIAHFDLTRPIHIQTNDETGRLLASLRTMQTALTGLIGDVRSSTDSINTASAEIATGNMDLSSRTEQTASNLQQAAASLTQLTGTVRQTADAATTANQLASHATSTAQRGGTVMGQVVSTMSEISDSSRRIGDIIGVIDGIAFQTNILALNAAVEAARAGEQGRGFAVVASEVRSLAQRSAEAAKEIKTLIATSVERVESGSRLVSDAGTTMNDIVQSVQRVTDIIAEISAATHEQSDGIQQVNAAVGHLDQMTQQNAALVEEAASAAESLKDQSHKLSGAVSVFRLGH
ncbi:methyl-accepting chemotaxis protein [Roseateles depolymerans]|uniref:Methyl-accepting chemotaxis protein n=1 Tax=Roseateles depolymerans TaxID=76731 RepID=A0A0U3C992_9BURK|nr:methyl-accepting chemotaxis protein [Roseateles depolymerans]ALV05336.1 Methyl-accepting chemotaxis protein [Roseateles depolymerans]REG14648.1 methyl-accepting chemotaxis protein [Roseateles depolymerans]